ncbi:pyocin activator PrtN family protein [Bradyrhizobium sp. Gha]|uniref:pyocin activator PrtN family protein n=1 Tax=Bradyrhizobium sp. Gha TaxID=1855318 RepID=UPI0032DEAA79
MNTAFLLMTQYGGKAIIPIEDVCRDYLSHLNSIKLVQKISAAELAISLVRIEASQKCAKGIHLLDPANYHNARVEAARKEVAALTARGRLLAVDEVQRHAGRTPHGDVSVCRGRLRPIVFQAVLDVHAGARTLE